MFRLLFLVASLISSPKDHPDFDELYLKEGTRLISDYSDFELDNYFDKIRPKFFGYDSKIITDGEIIEYTSSGDFSYTNDGEVDYSYEKSGTKKKMTKTSVNFEGELSFSSDIPLKKIASKLGAKLKLSASGDYSSQNSVEESFNLKIKVKPHTKVTEKIRGKARLTNGVAKRYIAFVESKAGTFEIIEPISETTWFMEEYV